MIDDAWLIAAYVVSGMLVVFGVARLVMAGLVRLKPFAMLSSEAPSPVSAAAALFGVILVGLTCVAWLRGRMHGAGWMWWAFTGLWLAPVLAEVPRTRRYLRDRELRRGRIIVLLGATVLVLMTCALLGLGVATVPFWIDLVSRHAG